MHRYEVKEVVLSKDHPQWPNEIVLKVFDNKNNYLSMACYDRNELVDNVVTKLNTGVGWIS